MGKSQNQKPRGQSRSSDHQRAVDERRRSNAAGPHQSTRDRKTIQREQDAELAIDFDNWRSETFDRFDESD